MRSSSLRGGIAVLLAGALCLGLAACGGGGDDTSGGGSTASATGAATSRTTTPAPSSPAAGSEATAGGGGTTGSDGAGSKGGTDGTGTGTGDGATKAGKTDQVTRSFCAAGDAMVAEIGNIESDDPAKAAGQFRRAHQLMSSMTAPTEIKGAWKTVTDAMGEMAGAAETLAKKPADAKALQTYEQSMDSAEAIAASVALSEFTDTNCK